MTLVENNLTTYGLQIELTKSQNENFVRIQNHWHLFNNELKKYNLHQNGANWEKYDFRFQWNKTTSIIDIYLPLNTNFE